MDVCLDSTQISTVPCARTYSPLITEPTQSKQGQIVQIAMMQKADLGSKWENGEELNFRVHLDSGEVLG